MAKRIVLEGPAADAVERLAQSGRMSIADLITSALRREAAAQEDNATGESVKSASVVKSPDAKAPAGHADEDEDQVEPTSKAFLHLVTSTEIPEGPSAGPEAGPLRRENP